MSDTTRTLSGCPPAGAGIPPSTGAPEPTTTPGLTAAAGLALMVGGFVGNLIFGASTLLAPSIAADLGIGTDGATLTVALFPLGFAVVLVLGGRLGDRYGRRLVYRLGLVGLVITSVAVALAPGAVTLLGARFLQGTAAGIMLPQVLSTIQHTAVDHARARWQAWYGAVIGAGTIVGMLLAGVLMLGGSPAGWRLMFWAIALLSGVALVLSVLVPETRSPHRRTSGLDGVGTVLLAVGLGGVLLALAVGRTRGWPWWIDAGLLASLLVLVVFGWWERRRPAEQALLPPAALAEPALATGLAMAVAFFAGYGAFLYVVTATLQARARLSGLASAGELVLFTLGFIVTAVLLPRLSGRWPRPRLLRTGAFAQAALLVAIAALWWSDPLPSPWLLQPLLTLLGAAQAFMYNPLLGTVMSAVPSRIAGLSSGLFSTGQQLGNSVGVTLFGLVFAGLGGAGAAASLPACLLVQAAVAVAFAAATGLLPVSSPAPIRRSMR